jgi:lipopolysaccharide transport system ATP-binding protein
MSAARTEQPVIRLKDVGFFYQLRKGYFSSEQFWALKSISFTLYKGESLGIIGRNGAGKSTLLRLLSGIVAADKGEVVNFGYSTTLLSLQAGFIPYLTGRENTLLNGLLLGLNKGSILERMDEIKSFSELGDYFEQPIRSYSTGMLARLGFSIAFQLDPDVLLLDEVMGVGDQKFRDKSTAKLLDKIRSEKTVVLVSHIPSIVQELCDRAVLIENGATVIEDDTKTVLSVYRDLLKQQPPGQWQLVNKYPAGN